jgi:hypothetical protein
MKGFRFTSYISSSFPKLLAAITSTEVSNRTFVACGGVRDRGREGCMPFCVARVDLHNDGTVDRGLGQEASHHNKQDASPVGGGERCYALTGLRD